MLDRAPASILRCEAVPISRLALNTAIGQPVVPFPQNRPVSGDPVSDRNVRAGLRRFLEQLDACARTGEPLRVWSLYAPEYLARLFQIQGPFDQATYDAYATPRPGGTGRGVRIESVDTIWKVRDGLYAVEAVKTYPSIPMPKRLVFWITDVGGRYLIEEITGEISFSLP
jgi:hypothetical protein